MQVVFKEEWSEANWKEVYTHPVHKGSPMAYVQGRALILLYWGRSA